MGSQRDFNTDAKGRAGKLDGAKLLFELEWLDAEAGDSSAAERKPTKYWCVDMGNDEG